MTTALGARSGGDLPARADSLVMWAEASGHGRAGGHAGGGLRFAFYGRVSTEDWQDPESSRARQREQAEALVCGQGQVVAEFFDEGESRSVAWGRRPQAAALVALLADARRGWAALRIYEERRALAVVTRLRSLLAGLRA
jgi:site-specific DNA recombinase